MGLQGMYTHMYTLRLCAAPSKELRRTTLCTKSIDLAHRFITHTGFLRFMVALTSKLLGPTINITPCKYLLLINKFGMYIGTPESWQNCQSCELVWTNSTFSQCNNTPPSHKIVAFPTKLAVLKFLTLLYTFFSQGFFD